MNHELYDFLKRVASERRMVTYHDVMGFVGVKSTKLTADRKKIDKALAEICRLEVDQRRPMLSVVVVKKNKNIPGTGFFDLAKELGRHRTQNDHEFFAKELSQVLTRWADRK